MSRGSPGAANVEGTGSSAANAASRKVRIDFMAYEGDTFVEASDIDAADAVSRAETATGVRWIHVSCVQKAEDADAFARAYDLHPLTLEDIVSPGQRPKMEPYDDYLFLVLRMLRTDPGPGTRVGGNVTTEQLTIVLKDSLVLSFQQDGDGALDAIRDRLRQGKGRARSMGADYLAYLLMDRVVDGYLDVLERLDEVSGGLETAMQHDTSIATLERVGRLKRQVQTVRRAAWPLREVLAALSKDGGGHITPPVMTFLRDAHDHVIQTIDTVENLRELLNGLHDLFLSLSSNRMNEIMKVLTIISTIFIPLTFLVGVYGMNFRNMPEYAWRWAYPALWILMLSVGGAMIAMFRRARWL